MMHCGFAGILTLVGAFAVVKMLLRALRGHSYRRFGGGCGPRYDRGGPNGPYRGDHGRWDERGDWQDQGGRDRWGARKLGWLLESLETTPEQERVLFETFDDLKGAGRTIAGKVAQSRAQWADALEADSFDETMVGSAVADLEHAVDEARKTAIDAFAKVHGTLDAPQRKRLASWLRTRRGPFRGFGR